MSTPERLTPTQRLHEVTMAALLRRPSEPEQSVTLARGLKGIATFEVTGRGHNLNDTLATTLAAFETLNDTYPYPGTDGES